MADVPRYRLKFWDLELRQRFKRLHCQQLTDLVGSVLSDPFPDRVRHIYQVPDDGGDPHTVDKAISGNFFAEYVEDGGSIFTVVYFVDKPGMAVWMTDVDIYP